MKNKGFTLIELMVVIVIMGILASLAIPRFLRATDKAKLTEWKSIVKQIVTLQEAYRQYYDTYASQGTPVGLAISEYSGAKKINCPDVNDSICKLIGFNKPGKQSRFNYWTSGSVSSLGACEIAVDIGEIKAGTAGYMDSSLTISGELTNY